MNENDPVIPLSLMVSRFEKHRDYYLGKLKRTPWWAWKRRQAFAASAAVYEFEIEHAMRFGGAVVLKRLFNKSK
jgi:hypothetical protein